MLKVVVCCVKSVSMRNSFCKALYGNETTHCRVSEFYGRHDMVIGCAYVTFQGLIHGSKKNNLKDS